MAEINLTFTRNRDYRDLSLTMAKNPVTDDVVTVSGEEAVKRSIKNLLMTACGEVPFFPEFGSRLSTLLFEPIDPITTALLRSEITATIEGFEPRVRIKSLTITPTEDESKYQVDLTLLLVTMTNPITFTVYLSRLR